MERDVNLSVSLTPVFWNDTPNIKIQFNQQLLFLGKLTKQKVFKWNLPAIDKNRLSIFFLNKSDEDTVDDKDKAIIIDSIGIEGFNYNSFFTHSQYKPDYSPGYYRYAKEHNLSVDKIINTNYLGFNGEWWLEFDWPVFAWIYQVETNGLGWIYEKNI
jgi:hypothetical protein